MTDDLAYPSVDLVLDLHKQIIAEGDTTEPGVRSEDAIASALQYISEGFFGEVPETIHSTLTGSAESPSSSASERER